MPRIDPLSLLKCLSILLGPNGGIKSSDEVHRIANLMTKFSKKLVSKCIYIQILKNTNTDLLNQFMAAGGWNLIHIWLTDAVVVKNWALIEELLSLLLLCPVDIERLKSNNCPKFIKGLSKEDSHQNVKLLATRLVEQWLKIVKGEAPPNSVPAHIMIGTNVTNVIAPITSPATIVSASTAQSSSAVTPVVTIPATTVVEGTSTTTVPISCTTISSTSEVEQTESCALSAIKSETLQEPSIEDEQSESQQTSPKKQTVVVVTSASTVPSSPVYKITIRDGKQVLTKVETDGTSVNSATAQSVKQEIIETNGELIKSEVVESVVNVKDENVEDPKVPVKVEIKAETPEQVIKQETKSEGESKSAKSPKDGAESAKSVSDKENRDGHKKDEKKKSNSNHSSSSRSSSKHSSSSHRSSSHKSSSSKSSSKHKTSSDKDKDKDKDKDHSSSSSSSKSSSSSNSNKKEKGKKDQAEKDKATLEKVQSHSLSKSIGKIPKKKNEEEKKPATESKDNAKENKDKEKVATSVMDEKARKLAIIAEKKNISISIENRKTQDGASRPKTVKTFNSKFRSTGLEEEIKPPPPRPQTVKRPATNSILPEKKPIVLPKLPVVPIRETSAPSAEKKIKLSLDSMTNVEEKKGGIKLIKPKRIKWILYVIYNSVHFSIISKQLALQC